MFEELWSLSKFKINFWSNTSDRRTPCSSYATRARDTTVFGAFYSLSHIFKALSNPVLVTNKVKVIPYSLSGFFSYQPLTLLIRVGPESPFTFFLRCPFLTFTCRILGVFFDEL